MKRLLLSFVMLYGMCSMVFAGTGFEVSPPVNNLQNSPPSASQFNISRYVSMVVDATRARDNLKDSNPEAAKNNYNAAISNIQNQLKQERINQRRAERDIVHVAFHGWASDKSFYGRGHKYARQDIVVSAPDGSWELEAPLEAVEHGRNVSRGGGINDYRHPRREGNNVIFYVELKGADYGHKDTKVWATARGQYKRTEGYVIQKVNEEFPFLWQRVNDAVTVQWK